ncbi:MAG: dTDP-glucose 4,6-dehydratase [Desulfobacteraceae bacterium]|nr:dTDP-glucose 4,6-dehydratase [Desulfobacteraceae bacterium]MBC2754966.1 dTDP-glucose 4,6-dehydratase [Desulfobacteraceae bacterium]
MNLLVTGGCGFIGTNFIRYLLNNSDFTGRIINVDRLTYAGNPENLADIEKMFPDHYTFVQADICDPEKMTGIFDDHDIDTVCHFAAESHVDRSIVSPDDFIKTNIIGTFNLLETSRNRKNRLARFHHISTDEVYGSLGKDGYFVETTPYQPSSPYSASKASSDHLVRAYHTTYNLPVTLSNCSNNYGPYQFPEKLIPLMILNALEGKPLPVYGDGKNVRDWLYVDDHCSAIWKIIRHGKEGETYNVGGDCELENIKLVEMICDAIDNRIGKDSDKSRKELITFVTDRPGHDQRYAIDASKIRNEIGWTPKTTIETGLDHTIKWYLDHMEWVDHVKSGEYQSWISKHYK